MKVTTPTLMPTERARRVPPESAAQPATGIEIKLSNGHSVVVHGRVDPKSLARLIDILVRR